MGMRDPRIWLAGAVLWGFSEATFFFIVPDLLLTAAVLVFGLSRAFKFSVIAAVAAAIGGLAMLSFGASNAEAARTFLLSVPLIGEDLLMRVQMEMQGAWPVHLTAGAVTGAPYKIYAVEAGAAGVHPIFFLIVSFVARLLRFSLAISLAAGGFALSRRIGLRRLNAPGLALAWAAIYVAYIAVRLSAD